MAQAAENIKSPRTIGDLARDALIEREWNVEKASGYLCMVLRSDKRMLQEIIDSAVHEAVRQKATAHVMSNRAGVVRRAPDPDSKATVTALARGLAAAWMDFPLMGGTKLRMATREQVVQQADSYDRQIGDMSHKAKWLRVVAQSLPDGKTVEDCLTEVRLNELWKETEND